MLRIAANQRTNIDHDYRIRFVLRFDVQKLDATLWETSLSAGAPRDQI